MVYAQIVTFGTDTRLQKVDNLQFAGSGTNFIKVLQFLQSVVKSYDTNRVHHIIFLTDGQADSDPRQESKNWLKYITSAKLKVATHCLGLSSFDANLLQALVADSTLPGTFQGQDEGAGGARFDLGVSVDRIVQVVAGEAGRTRATLTCNIGDFNFRIASPASLFQPPVTEASAAAAVAASEQSASAAAGGGSGGGGASAAVASPPKKGGGAANPLTVDIVWKADCPSVVAVYVTCDVKTMSEKSPKLPFTLAYEEGGQNYSVPLSVSVSTNPVNCTSLFVDWCSERLAPISAALTSNPGSDKVKQYTAIVDSVEKEWKEMTATVSAGSFADVVPDVKARDELKARVAGTGDLIRGCRSAFKELTSSHYSGNLSRGVQVSMMNQAYQQQFQPQQRGYF